MDGKNHTFVAKEVHLSPGKITFLSIKKLPSQRVTITGSRKKSARKILTLHFTFIFPERAKMNKPSKKTQIAFMAGKSQTF